MSSTQKAVAARRNEVTDHGLSTQVVRTYLWIRVLDASSAACIWGVGTLFLLHVGLNLFEVFAVNALTTAVSAAAEIPAGVVSDALGRRFAFILSVTLLLAATLGYVGADHFGASLGYICVFATINGVAYAFLSGSSESWVVDALRTTGYVGSVEQVLARGSILSNAAMMVGSVAGGAISNLGASVPYCARTLMLIALLLFTSARMRDLGFETRRVALAHAPAAMCRLALGTLRYTGQNASVSLVLAVSTIQATFHAWALQVWQPYFVKLLGQEDGWMTGTVAALTALMYMLGNWAIGPCMRHCRKRTSLMIGATFLQAAATIGLALAGSFGLALVCYLASAVGAGVYGPIKQTYLHLNVESGQRATMLSFESLTVRGGNMVGQLGLGAIARVQSISIAYLAGGLVFATTLPLLLLLQRRRDDCDNFRIHAGNGRGQLNTC